MKGRNEKKGGVLYTALAATSRMLLTGVEIIEERKANMEKEQWRTYVKISWWMRCFVCWEILLLRTSIMKTWSALRCKYDLRVASSFTAFISSVRESRPSKHHLQWAVKEQRAQKKAVRLAGPDVSLWKMLRCDSTALEWRSLTHGRCDVKAISDSNEDFRTFSEDKNCNPPLDGLFTGVFSS